MEDDTNKQSLLTFETLRELREKTQAVFSFIEKRLRTHLDMLRSLLAPKRLLGNHVGGTEEVVGANQAVAEVQERYKGLCRNPFALPADSFVLNAVVFSEVLKAFPDVVQVPVDLGHKVHSGSLPGFGELPVTIVDEPLGSFRPPDPLLLKATRLSGVPAFIELIDVDSLGKIQDPLRKLGAMVA